MVSLAMRFRSPLRSLMAGVCCMLASTVAAKDLHPGVIGEDYRVTVQTHESPWDAIGHVNIAGYRTIRRCSGVLVRPNVVLTAAHCLLDPRTLRGVAADRVHFLLGVHGGEWKAHSMAKCFIFPETDQRR